MMIPRRYNCHAVGALQAAKEQDFRVIVAHFNAGIGRLKQSLGQQAEVRKDLSRACEMYREMQMAYYLDQAQEDLATPD